MAESERSQEKWSSPDTRSWEGRHGRIKPGWGRMSVGLNWRARSQSLFTKPSDLVLQCVSAEENSIRDRDNHSLGEFWRWPLQHDRWQSRCLIYVLQGGTINLLRRYTDFVRLRNALKSTYPVCRRWNLKDEVSSSLTARRSICTTPSPNSRAKLICVSTLHASVQRRHG